MLTPELESFIDNHTKIPKVIDATEINISSACALKIRTRGGFNGIIGDHTSVYLVVI